MSAIHPTHPPGMHPQDDRHFIGTLHLTGCQSEDDSILLPPPYVVSMRAACKEGAIEHLHDALYDAKSTSAMKWDTLITACEEAKIKLKASLVDLDQNGFKTYLLKEEKTVVQQQLEAGLAQVQVVHAATQALCQEDTPAHLLALEAALKGLEAVKPTVSIAQPCSTTPIQSERINRWMQVIKNYLGPIALTGWGLIVQSGILSSDTAKRIPLVGGIMGLCLKIKENIDTCMEQAKTEDQAGLIQICNSLVEIFMNVDRIGKAVQETLAARKQQEESLQYIRDAHKDLRDARKEHDVYKQNFNSNIQKLGSTTDQLNSMTDHLNLTTYQLNQLLHSDQLGQLLNSDALSKLAKHDSDISELQKGQKSILESLDFIKKLLLSQSDTQHSTLDNAA